MNEPHDVPTISSSDETDRPGLLERAFDAVAEKVDQHIGWYQLPEPLGLVELIGIRNTLREHNLYDTSRLPADNAQQPPAFEGKYVSERAVDGSWNDLVHPEMGMAGTRFGRNVPLDETWPQRDRMFEPSPRTISRRLMTRDELIPAATGNALIAAWLQFMIRDWFKHGVSPSDNPWVIPLAPDDDWPTPPLLVMRTPTDPTAPLRSDQPPTHINIMSHWWDGSQLYGNSIAEQGALRSHVGGRLSLVDGMAPVPDAAQGPARSPGFWFGL